MESALQPRAPQSFTVFHSLPIEIRCAIWSWAAPRRPRVIQLFYRPNTKSWHACKDGCGGLPSIVHVSREARAEALKGYTRAFDAYVDLEEDTIFISDPVFALREPIKAFFDAEHVKKLNNIAILSDIYQGLDQSGIEFPTLCDRPSAILRKLESLTHFTLALSEDGEKDVYDAVTEGSDDGYDNGDRDDEGLDSGVEDVDAVGIGPSHRDQQESQLDSTAAGTEVESQEARKIRRRIDRLEKEALAVMSKGYVRHTGNVHFESAMDCVDHWDDWEFYKAMITDDHHEEKVEHPEWTRPKVSIMVLKYGLKRIGDFSGPVHIRGDHNGLILEDSEYPPGDESESDSQEEDYWNIHDWGPNDYIFMGEYEEVDYDAIWEL